MKRQRTQDSQDSQGTEDGKNGDLIDLVVTELTPCVLLTDATSPCEIVHTIIELDGSSKLLRLLEQALEENFKDTGKWKYDNCNTDGFGVDDLDGILTGLYKDKDEAFDDDYVEPMEIVDELYDYMVGVSMHTLKTPVSDRNKELSTKWNRVKYMITIIES
jgi:hypothetical protein